MLEKMQGRPQESADTQYVPATTGESLPDTVRRQGTAMFDRAMQYYRENPKKVQALGAVAAAALLVGLKRRGRV
jgi:hypothetical protein